MTRVGKPKRERGNAGSQIVFSNFQEFLLGRPRSMGDLFLDAAEILFEQLGGAITASTMAAARRFLGSQVLEFGLAVDQFSNFVL